MKKYVMFIVFLIVFIITISLNCTKTGTSYFEGKISSAFTKKTLSGVRITINNIEQSMVTNTDGCFLVKYLKSGPLSVTFHKEGYQSVSVPDAILEDSLITYLEVELSPDIDWIPSLTATSKGKTINSNQISSYKISDEFLGLNKSDDEYRFISKKVAGDSRADLTGKTFFKWTATGSSDKYAMIDFSGSDISSERLSTCSGVIEIPNWKGEIGASYSVPKDKLKSEKTYSDKSSILFAASPFIETADDSISTFGSDFGTETVAQIKYIIERNRFPGWDDVHVEEFINNFSFKYPAPVGKTFRINTAAKASVLSQDCRLLRIGIQGKTHNIEKRPPAHLIFVIDISGSMDFKDHLRLIKKALMMLTQQLQPGDKVGIVPYDSRVGLNLEHTANKDSIISFITELKAKNPINLENVMLESYHLAVKYFDADKTNRVILCTDRVATAGNSYYQAILKNAEGYRKQGITLTICSFSDYSGFDVGPLNKLAVKGGGTCHFIGDFKHARRVFLGQLSGTFQNIARDVKARVIFDKNVVSRYRIIGKEKKDAADLGYRDDINGKGGEIDAGHSATALYDIKLKDSTASKIGTISLRWITPDNKSFEEITEPILLTPPSAEKEDEYNFISAVALYAEMLRGSYWEKGDSINSVIAILQSLSPKFRETYPDYSEFAEMVYRTLLIQEEMYAEKQ